ncbi:MAG: toxin-antitoxin system HicB family antitoxin [Acutalibacteraceae bacterium]|nr:toxin-antitoxin system HicB family antitoxin [Acutalibacteraceae bacterium]
MAKKTFKDNPALQFISTEESTAEQTQETAQTEQPDTAKQPPKGYKLNPLYLETKSRRVQLILQPSLHEKVRQAAQAEGISFNEYVHRVLEQAVKVKE